MSRQFCGTFFLSLVLGSHVCRLCYIGISVRPSSICTTWSLVYGWFGLPPQSTPSIHSELKQNCNGTFQKFVCCLFDLGLSSGSQLFSCFACFCGTFFLSLILGSHVCCLCYIGISVHPSSICTLWNFVYGWFGLIIFRNVVNVKFLFGLHHIL